MNCPRLLKLTSSIILSLSAANSAQIIAQTEAPPHAAVGDCSREFLIAYFPPSLVEDALQKANISRDKWPAITKALTASEKDIITQVEEKASKITPNPLKDPQQRQTAVKIFKETLLNVFSNVLKKNGITDDKQIQDMLDGIQQEKAKKFTDCLEKHKIPSLKEMQKQSGDSDSPLADATTDKKTPLNSKDSSNHLSNKPADKNSAYHHHHDEDEDSSDSDDEADGDDEGDDHDYDDEHHHHTH